MTIDSKYAYVNRRSFARLALGAIPAVSVSSCGERYSRVLDITFQGPFIFRFRRECVLALVPVCYEHESYVQTDQQRFLMSALESVAPAAKAGYQYELTIAGRSSSVGTQCPNIHKILALDWNIVKDPHGPVPQVCAWQLKLPRPDLIVGQAVVYLAYQPVGTASLQPFCGEVSTGIRFFYAGVSSQQIMLTGKPEPCTHLNLSVYPEPPRMQSNIPILFRTSPRVPSDTPHVDAAYGFAQMRALVPPLSDWNVSFSGSCQQGGTMKNSEPVAGDNRDHAGDCGAVPIIFSDSVELSRWRRS